MLALALAACSQATSTDVASTVGGAPEVTAPVSGGGSSSNDSGSGSVDGGSGSSWNDTGSIDVATLERRSRAEEDRLDYVDLPPQVAASLSATSGVRYRVRPVAGYLKMFEYTLVNTGSGWQEKFLLQAPRLRPTTPRPLLVVFHRYGVSHADLIASGFLPEVMARDWFAICPLGARQRNFGNLESQINIQAALDLVSHLYLIDQQRIYGVGFSMGGGSAVNYAARHVDPTGVRFAAVCDHTGSVSLAHTWANEWDDSDVGDNLPLPGDNLEVPDVLEDLFGGTPLVVPFAYQRCSTIDLDPFTGQIGANTDFSRNLGHVPTLVWRAAFDPNAYLVDQTDRFDQHVQTQNASNQYQLASSNAHAWSTLDPALVCNWFATHTLSQPNSGSTLADEDGRWFHFQVEQDAAGSFTPFTWSVDAATKHVTVSATQNLKRLSFLPSGHGLALTGAVTVDMSTADATGDRFTILEALNAPVSVTRDGVTMVGGYDALAKTFTIVETDGAPHQWVVTFP